MQRGDAHQLVVTSEKDPSTKEDLLVIHAGLYTTFKLTMDEGGALENAIARVRQLCRDKRVNQAVSIKPKSTPTPAEQ